MTAALRTTACGLLVVFLLPVVVSCLSMSTKPKVGDSRVASRTKTASIQTPANTTQSEEHDPTRVTTVSMKSPQKSSDEPFILSKLERRIRVFALAGRVFLSYKLVQWKESRIRRKYGLDDDDDDHPAILELWDRAHQTNANRILRGIEHLQGFWVKVGQYISSRADVMPPQYLQTLATLQDGVPAKPFEHVQTTLAEQLSPQELARIQYIDPEPLSTASLAQVHRATLTDGRDVVIKAQHRGVSSLMIQDMENLQTILDLLSKSDPDLDYTPVVDEYTREVVKELDFRLEAQNMNEVRDLLKRRSITAIIPQVVPELVTSKILVMDFCAGFPIRDIESLDRYKVDRRLLLERVCTAWAAQIHCQGTFNSDPHAGNILVSTAIDGDPSVPVLLDFGLTKRLEPKMRIAFSRLVHSSHETDVDGLLQSFDEMGLVLNRYDPFEDMAVMQKSLSDTVPQSEAADAKKQRMKESKAKEEATRRDQKIEKNTKLRNPVDAWPSELIFFTRVTAMLRGLCSKLEVRYPYLATMAEAASETLRHAVPEHERAVELIHPSAHEIDTNLQKKIRDAALDVIKGDHAVGMQVCVVSNGAIVANVAAGTLGTANPRPVTPSSLFNVFSVSKAVLATGVLVMLDENGISVDDTIAKHWPEFGESHPDKKLITIRHALSHQAGLANAFPPNASIDTLTDWDQMKNFIASSNAVPAHVPGEETHYHYLTFAWLLGGLIEEVTGEPYENFLTKHLLYPLGIADELHMGGLPDDAAMEELAVLTARTLKASTTNKGPPPVKNARNETGGSSEPSSQLAKFKGREQMLNPSVFNMRKVRAAKIPSANGHASAVALATFMDAVISCDPSRQILSSARLDEARVPQMHLGTLASTNAMLDNSGASFGLGFQLHNVERDDGTMVRSIGHAGFGGSIVIGIPELGLSVAFTTNQLNFKSVARDKMLGIVFRELGLEPPASLTDA